MCENLRTMPLIGLILHLKCLNRERVAFRIRRNHTAITVETGKLISNFCYMFVFIRWIAFNILLCFPINNSIRSHADFRLWTDERWAANELLKWNLINNNWLHFALRANKFYCFYYKLYFYYFFFISIDWVLCEARVSKSLP